MWKNDKKCAVALSFDVDAESLFATINVSSPTPLSRGYYGARVGVPRILSMLEKHDIRATFFVPADTARRHPDTIKEIHSKGHEIGHHGDVHESPVNVDREEEKRILDVGIEELQKITGEVPKGYRSPAWDLSPNSIQLFEEYGFLWDSSMMHDDFQLYNLKDGDRETKVVEIPVAWELDDAPFYLFNFFPVYTVGMSSPSKVYEIWSSEFDGAYENQGVYTLTMHPQLTGRWHRLQVLDKLIGYIKNHDDVWFATCTEIVEDWLKRQN